MKIKRKNLKDIIELLQEKYDSSKDDEELINIEFTVKEELGIF